MTPLITVEQHALLLANGAEFDRNVNFDPPPVVKLFTPDAAATWLLAALDPEEPDIAFGLCDLGLGYPELGSVRISEIASVRGRFGMPPKRDGGFIGRKPISAYAADACLAGHIVIR